MVLEQMKNKTLRVEELSSKTQNHRESSLDEAVSDLYEPLDTAFDN